MERMRLIRSRWITIGGTSLLLFGGFWMLYLRPLQHHKTRPEPVTADGIKLGSIYLDVYGETGKQNTLQWTLTAVDATLSEDGTIHSQGIRDGRFYHNGAVTAQFTAGPAVYNKTSNNLDLQPPVRVDGVNNVHLQCGALHYTFKTRRLTAEGPVQVTSPNTQFKAGHLDADLALSELNCEATPTQPVSLVSKIQEK